MTLIRLLMLVRCIILVERHFRSHDASPPAVSSSSRKDEHDA